MYEIVSENDTSKEVIKLINDISSKLSYYEIAIQIGVLDKTIYKWRKGSIPRADKYLSLKSLHKHLFN